MIFSNADGDGDGGDGPDETPPDRGGKPALRVVK
jgi:hypothetical protein